jgi:hypothetical protein
MSIELWVTIALGAFLALSLAVGLAVAAIFARIGEAVSEVLETELCASAPLRREIEQRERSVRDEHEKVLVGAGSPQRPW